MNITICNKFDQLKIQLYNIFIHDILIEDMQYVLHLKCITI